MYEFGMTEQNQNKTKKENYVIQIQVVSLSIEKTENTYEDITKNVVNRFDMSNYELERRQVKRKKTNKIISLMKDELGGKTRKHLQSKNIQLFNRRQRSKKKGKNYNKICNKKKT